MPPMSSLDGTKRGPERETAVSIEDPPSLDDLNKTELLQILAKPSNGGYRLKTSIPKERLIQLVRTGEPPTSEEISPTTETRSRLQYWIRNMAWDGINSQLPCTGENRGMCVTYPCSEGRHLLCFLSAKKYL